MGGNVVPGGRARVACAAGLAITAGLGLAGLGVGCRAAELTLFAEDLSDNSAGWSLGPIWEVGPASAGCGDPAGDRAPTGGEDLAGVVIGGCAPTAEHEPYFPISPVIDLSGLADGESSFPRWPTSDRPSYIQGRVEPMAEETTWTTVHASVSVGSIVDGAWTGTSIDLAVRLTDAFRLRIGHAIGGGGVHGVDGWSVDDMRISSGEPAVAVPLPLSAPLAAFGLATLGILVRRRRD